MKTQWKIITNFPNYEISDKGEVRQTETGKPRKVQKHLGYNRVVLINGGTRKQCRVARLVAEAFIPNPDNQTQVRHINGNSLDDRIYNLEWTDVLGVNQDRNPIKGTNIETQEVIHLGNAKQGEALGFKPALIGLCVRGLQNTHKGYRWEKVRKHGK